MEADEDYHNAFLHLILMIRNIAQGPREKTPDERNFNVTGEMAWDVMTMAPAVLGSVSSTLSQEQQASLQAFVAHLSELSEGARWDTVVGGDVPGTIMAHPAWVPICQEATELLRKLSSAIEHNEGYLNGEA